MGTEADATPILTFVGAGGDYVQQTTYKYVGHGAGNFATVPVTTGFRSNFCCLIWSLLALLLIPLLWMLLQMSSEQTTLPPVILPPGVCKIFGDPHLITKFHFFFHVFFS